MSTQQIIYLCCSLPLVALFVYLGTLIKNQKAKNGYLIFWAMLCFFLHISTMYTTFFESATNHGNAYDNQLFPIYFCNFMMYLLMIVSIWNDKSTKLFANVATFTAWGGIFGGLITVFVQEPDFAHWYNLQSSLSHTCLLLGCSFIFAGGYAKLNVFNLIPYTFGLLSCGVIGGIVELVFYLGGKPSPNAMYLVHGPVEAPMMHGGFFALAMIGIIFVLMVIYEQIFKKDPNTRWYKSIEDINLYLPIRKKAKN